MKILDIGCGPYPIEGADTMDFRSLPNLTYLHDIRGFPYPIKDKSYDIIYMNNTLEHFTYDIIPKILKEIKRILKDNGEVRITVPYLSSNSSIQDPTHLTRFSYFTFDYWCYENNSHIEVHYTPQVLKLKSKKLIFCKKGIRFLNFFLEKVFNKFPIHYENLLKYIIPAGNLEIVLIK